MRTGSMDAFARVPSADGELRDTPRTGVLATVVVLGGLLVRIGVDLIVGSQFTDDAWIFFRYARNAGAGHGLVYNVGESVYGFTSPLYTLLLSLESAALGPATLRAAAWSVGILCWVGLGWVGTALAVRTMPVPKLTGVVLAVWFPIVLSSLNGMETGLFMLLLMGSAYLLVVDRWDLGIVVMALAALTRPEGYLLIAMAAGLLLLVRPSRTPWRGMISAAALLAAWTGASVVLYGSPLPQSMLAKAGGPQSLGPAQIVRTVTTLTLGLSTSQLKRFGPVVVIAAGAVAAVIVALVVRDLVTLWRDRSPEVLLPAWFLCVVVGYSVAQPVTIWSWYTAPTALVAAWCTSRQLGRALLGWRAAARVPARTRTRIIVGAVAVCLLGALAITSGRRSDNLANVLDGLTVATSKVQSHVSRPDTVMVGDIGVVGWELDETRIYDLSALVTPAATGGADGNPPLADLIRREAPDALILSEDPRGRAETNTGSLRRPGLSGDEVDWFEERYSLVSRPGPDDERGRWVWVRVGRSASD